MGKHAESNSDKMYKLLNIDSAQDVLNENEITKLIQDDPSVCTERYPIDCISLELIYPLHAICALNGSLQLIKKVYKSYPLAIEDNTTTLGTALHYLCSYDATIDSIHFIAMKYPLAIENKNLKDRTPLHAACHYEAKYDVVAYLTEKFPSACTICDEDGYTPLHVACDLPTSKLVIVEDLTEVCPEACIMQGYYDKATPLHLAIKNSVDIEVIKDLVRANKDALSIKDDLGRLPLHVAIDIARTRTTSITTATTSTKDDLTDSDFIQYTMEILKTLTPRYPDALEIENGDGYTPQKLAEKYQLCQEIITYLDPYE